jgi:DNA polymerase III delta subunit
MPPRGKRRSSKTPALSASDLRDAVKAGTQRAFLLLGPEAFLRDEALDVLRGELLGDNPGPALHEFDGRKTELAVVLDELRTFPFLGAGHRLVIVRQAGGNGGFVAKHGEALAEFLAGSGMPDTSTLAVCAEKVDKRTKASKALLKATSIVDCDARDEAGLLAFVRRRAKVHGAAFKDRADRVLLDGLGGQDVPLASLDSEVRKLADAAAGAGGEIRPDDVRALASVGSSEQAFGLIDRMARGDTAGALELLARIFRDGLITAGGARTREAAGIAMILLPTLRWDLGRLLKARALVAKGRRDFEVTKELRVFRDKQTFLNRVRRADRDALGARHAVLRQADVDLRTSADPWGLMVRVVTALSLAERERRPAGAGRR